MQNRSPRLGVCPVEKVSPEPRVSKRFGAAGDNRSLTVAARVGPRLNRFPAASLARLRAARVSKRFCHRRRCLPVTVSCCFLRDRRLGAAVLFAVSALLAVCGSARAEASGDALYFPPASGEWKTVDPAEAGWRAAALEDLLSYSERQRSSGVVILLRGRILAERYWELETEPDNRRYAAMVVERTADGRTVEDVASAQKSVASFLAGVAEGKGLIELDAPVSKYLGAGWSQASAEQEERIKVRHVLSMASGLGEDGSFRAPAGEEWMYNTPIYSRVVKVIEAAAGLAVNEYTEQWLTARIGMSESRWAERPWVSESPWANRIGFATSARDLARFGLLVLAGGRWGEEDVLGNPGYLEKALSPSQSINPSYGYLWWLNGQPTIVSGRNNTKSRKGPLISSAPPDLVAAQGALGRKCYVVPSLDLVVTRLGAAPPDRAFNNEFWKRLMAAIPSGRQP